MGALFEKTETTAAEHAARSSAGRASRASTRLAAFGWRQRSDVALRIHDRPAAVRTYGAAHGDHGVDQWDAGEAVCISDWLRVPDPYAPLCGLESPRFPCRATVPRDEMRPSCLSFEHAPDLDEPAIHVAASAFAADVVVTGRSVLSARRHGIPESCLFLNAALSVRPPSSALQRRTRRSPPVSQVVAFRRPSIVLESADVGAVPGPDANPGFTLSALTQSRRVSGSSTFRTPCSGPARTGSKFHRRADACAYGSNRIHVSIIPCDLIIF